MESVKNKNNMDAIILTLNFQRKKNIYIKELKYSVISLKTANLSNPRMGFDSLGNRFFQFTQTVSKIFKFGEKQTY